MTIPLVTCARLSVISKVDARFSNHSGSLEKGQKMNTTPLNKENLESIVRGACLLSSGGGGTYTSGMNLLKNFVKSDYYPNGTVAMVSVENIPDSAKDCGVVIAYMGAPQAIADLPYPAAGVAAAEKVKSWLEAQGKRLAYVVPVEIGALSSIVACTVAAKLGVPVVDGDGAGRAVPELTMLTFASEGISPNPTILSNEDGLAFTLKVDDPTGKENPDALIELVARPVISLPIFNQQAGLAIWVMSVAEIKQAVKIRKTLSACQAIGEQIKRFQEQWEPKAVDRLMFLINNYLNTKSFVLCKGTLAAAQNLTSGGFDHGVVSIKDDKGSIFTILFQNESLLAWDNQCTDVQALAPDSIAYILEQDKQIVYSNGDLMENDALRKDLIGRTVSVIGIAAQKELREHENMRLQQRLTLGIQNINKNEIMKSFQDLLKQFGYYGPYVPIENIPRFN